MSRKREKAQARTPEKKSLCNLSTANGTTMESKLTVEGTAAFYIHGL